MSTISGAWKFNDVLTRPTVDFDESVSFEFALHYLFGGKTYNAIGKGNRIYTARAASGATLWGLNYQYDIHFIDLPEASDTPSSAMKGVYGNLDDQWLDDGEGEYQIIDFGTEPQAVSAEFYAWFRKNARPVFAHIRYNGSDIANVFGGQTATLKCEGMKMDSDVVVEVAEQSGGGDAVLAPLTVTENGTYYPTYEAATVTWDENTEYDGTIEVDGATLRYKKVANLTVPDDVSELENPAYCYTQTFADGWVDSYELRDLGVFEENGVYMVDTIGYAIVWVKDATMVNAAFNASLEDNTVYVTDYLWLAFGENAAGSSVSLTAQGQKIDGFSSVAVDVKVQPNLQEKTATENGEVLPDAGYDGLSKVNVAVSVIEEFDGTIYVR